MKLSELVKSLKEELRTASKEGQSDAMFKLSRASIKTRIAVVDKRLASGGVEIYVASADLEKSTENTSEHEVTVELEPLFDDIFMGEN
jgi:hypothetical protein